MENIYILSDRGKLSKSGNHLIFNDVTGLKKIIFPFKTRSIFASKPVSITAEAFVLIAENHIQLFFNTYNPNNNFTINYDSSNFLIKQKQYEMLENKEKTIPFARAIVLGKVKNQLSYIQRIKRNNLTLLEKTNLDKNIGQIKTIIGKIPNTNDINSLRGYEGIVSRIYFSILKYHIKPDWAIFEKRSQHPPKTNVNAVLSFIYTLLTNKITCLLQNFGFDPMIGIFHELTPGKNALAYDMVEQFRNTIADPLCCSLFNLGILVKDDFENINNPEPAVYLTKDGRAKVIVQFEEKLESTIYYSSLNKKQSYNQIMENQILQLKKTILDNKNDYKPFSLNY